MVLSVLILFTILYIYLKYPQVFDFKQNFLTGRFIRLERESGSVPINFANFIIYGNSSGSGNSNSNIINPIALNVNPALASGDGITPKANSTTDLSDIVLIETTSTSIPYVEYDLGSSKKISNITIFNRKKFNDRMSKTVLSILDENRNQIFEKKITDIQDIYSIDIL